MCKLFTTFFCFFITHFFPFKKLEKRQKKMKKTLLIWSWFYQNTLYFDFKAHHFSFFSKFTKIPSRFISKNHHRHSGGALILKFSFPCPSFLPSTTTATRQRHLGPTLIIKLKKLKNPPYVFLFLIQKKKKKKPENYRKYIIYTYIIYFGFSSFTAIPVPFAVRVELSTYTPTPTEEGLTIPF